MNPRSPTGRIKTPGPEIQQLPGALEKQVEALARVNADLQRQLAAARADYDQVIAIHQARERTAQKMIKDRDAQLAAARALVDTMVPCYNYGCGFYNQPGFLESLEKLFAIHGYSETGPNNEWTK